MKNTSPSLPSLLVGLAALDAFRDAAAHCAPTTCRADLPVVVANVNAAFRAVAPRLAEVPALLPKLDLAPVLEMPNLAQGLLYAGNRVASAASTKEVSRQIEKARRVREPMLVVAEGLAMMGLLPAERVAKIRAGTGSYDTARDVVDLVGLYREHAGAVANKCPFDEPWLTEAEAVGAWLLANLTPSGAAKAPSSDVDAAALLRDQLWTMLLERDVKLRIVASVLFEGRAESVVPALQSRVSGAAAEATSEKGAEPSKGPEDASGEAKPAAPAQPASEPVVAKPAAPGASTPPAPMRPKSAEVRERRAVARRKR